MSAAPTCPYCNALVDAGPGQRVVCPRCGEAFTARGDAITEGPPLPRPAPGFPPKPVRRNRLVGGVVLAVMVLMAAVGLTFALVTQPWRRAHDTALPRKRPANPEDLSILGYLPPGTNVVVGLNWERLNAVAGKDFLERPLGPGPFGVTPVRLPEWLGLDADDVRLVVAGLVVQRGQLVPTFVLLVRTRTPIDHDGWLKRLAKRGANPQSESADGRQMLRVDLPADAPLAALRYGYLTYADDQTVAFAYFKDSLKGVPERPAEKFANLAPELSDVLRDRTVAIDLSAPLWLAGASDNWPALPTDLGARADVPEPFAALRGVRRFAVWVRGGDPNNADVPVNLHVDLDCREGSLRAVRTWLLGPPRWWGWPQRPDLSWHVEGSWLMYQRRISWKDLRPGTEG